MSNNLNIVKFANIETPTFTNEITKFSHLDYVKFGLDNLFPNKILEFENKSTTHKACLNLKTISISGKGYDNTNLSEGAKTFLESVDYETSNSSLLEKIANSLAIFNGYCLEVIFSKAGLIVEINFLPFQNVRASKPDKYGEVNQYFYNSDWLNYSNDYEVIQAFGTIPNDSKGNPIKNYKRTKELLYISVYNSQSLVYPQPSYSSSLNWIACENEISKHHLSSAVNNFIPSSLITFFGNYTDEQKEEYTKTFKKEYTGSENSAKIIVAFPENSELAPKIESLNTSNLVDIYMNSSDEAKNNIITSHNITSPALIGINSNNSSIFSNGEELMTAWQVFYNTTIENYHNLIEKNMNLILKYAGFSDDKYSIIPFDPTYKKSQIA